MTHKIFTSVLIFSLLFALACVVTPVAAATAATGNRTDPARLHAPDYQKLLVLFFFVLIPPRIERAPVALLGAGGPVDEIGQLGGAAPARFAGIHHLGVLAEGEPGIQHLARGGAGARGTARRCRARSGGRRRWPASAWGSRRSPRRRCPRRRPTDRGCARASRRAGRTGRSCNAGLVKPLVIG